MACVSIVSLQDLWQILKVYTDLVGSFSRLLYTCNTSVRKCNTYKVINILITCNFCRKKRQ